MDVLFPPPRPEAETVQPIDEVVEVGAEPRPTPIDRPWIYTNMIASADGGTAVDGLSGELGGDGDRAMFRALRAAADVVIAGAATVRAEQYRMPTVADSLAEQRLAAGRPAYPDLAVLSVSLEFETDLPMFADSQRRPLIITDNRSDEGRRQRLADVADVEVVSNGPLELGPAMKLLHKRGARTALLEGGPSLNGQFIESDLVDEWNLTIAPRLLAADSRRAAVGRLPSSPPRGMTLSRVWTRDDYLFCRWVRDRS